MALFNFYIDIPEGTPLYWEMKHLLQDLNQIVFEDYSDSVDFYIRIAGHPIAIEPPCGLILVGEFISSEALPENTICLHSKTKHVLLEKFSIPLGSYLQEYDFPVRK